MALLLMEDDVDQMRDQMHEEQYKLRVERMQYFIQEAFEAYQFIGDIKDDEHRAFQEKLKNFLVVVQEDMQSFAKTLNIKGNKLLSNSYNSSWNGYQEKTKKIAKELQDAVSKLNRPLDVAQKQIFEKILAKIEKKYTQALVELKASDIRRILMHKLLEDELSTLAKTINAHPICFISYSWGPWDRVDSEHTGRVHRLAAHLKASGLKVVLDIWDNQVGDIHVFTQKIFTADKVLVMGSPHLVEKYNNYCSSGESRGMSDSYRGNVVAKEITYVLQRIGKKPPDNHGIVLGLMDGTHDKSFPEALQFLPSSDTDFAGSATISVDYVTKLFNLLERLFSEDYHLILKASKSKLEQLFGQLLHESDKQKLWNAYEKTYQRQGLLQWDKVLEESTVAPLNLSPKKHRQALENEEGQPPAKKRKVKIAEESENISIHLPSPYLGLIERPQLLAQLKEQLQLKSRLFIHGNTGTGKTSLLLAYAQAQNAYYKKKVWIEAGLDIISTYRQLLSLLIGQEHPGQRLQEQELIVQIITMMAHSIPSLIIFNNVTSKSKPSVEAFVEKLANNQKNIHIVLSQNESNGLLTFSSFPMPDAFEEDEALRFLDESGITFSEAQRAELLRLTQSHPLFLYAAVNCIHQRGGAIEAFLQNLSKWTDDEACCGHNKLPLKEMLAELWQPLSPKQKDILGFCAFIASEEISSDCLAKIYQDNTVYEELNNLRIFLKKSTTSCYRLHPLWAQLIKKELNKEHHGQLIIQNYAHQLAKTLQQHREIFSVCAPSSTQIHYRTSYQYAFSFYEQIKHDLDSLIAYPSYFFLIKEIIWYQLNINYDITNGLCLLNQYQIYYQKHDWLFYQTQLAMVDERQRNYSAAQVKFECICNVLAAQNKKETAEYEIKSWHVFHNLFNQGKMVDIQEMRGSLVKLREFLNKESHNKYLAYYVLKYSSLLGNASQKKGKNFYKEAEEHYQAAIEIAKKYDLPLINTYVKLASLYRDGRRYVEALQQLKEAAEKIEHYYGKDHSEMADCLNEQGNVLVSQGDFDPALTSYQESEKLYRRCNMREHHAKALTNIGYVYYAQGHLSKAKQLLEQSITEYQGLSNLQEPHYRLIYTYLNYSKVATRSGDLTEAIEYLKKAIAIGEIHFDKATLSHKMCHYFVPAIPWQKRGELKSDPEEYYTLFNKTCMLYGAIHPETFEQHFYELASRLKHPVYRSHTKEELIALIHEFCILLKDIISFNNQNTQENQARFLAVTQANIQLIHEAIVDAFKALSNKLAQADSPQKNKEKLKTQSTLQESWGMADSLVEFKGITFHTIDLSYLDFERYSFKQCIFEKVQFNHACLKSVQFTECEFLHCEFENAELAQANFSTIHSFIECKTNEILDKKRMYLPRGIQCFSGLNGYRMQQASLTYAPTSSSSTAIPVLREGRLQIPAENNLQGITANSATLVPVVRAYRLNESSARALEAGQCSADAMNLPPPAVAGSSHDPASFGSQN